MCINPIKIPNVNRGKAHIGTLFTKDCDNEYMYVPCGHCPDCVAKDQAYFVQRAEIEAEYNHVFFATLTYDNKHLPSLDVYVPKEKIEDLQTSIDFESVESVAVRQEREAARTASLIDEFDARSSEIDTDFSVPEHEYVDADSFTPNEAFCDLASGLKKVTFTYADIAHIQLMMKNIRDNVDFEGRSLKYVCVSELGKTNGRPHFHILFFIQKKKSDLMVNGHANPAVTTRLERKLRDGCFKYWAQNVGTRKNPVYEKRFTYARKFYGGKCYTNFDLHYVDPQGKVTLSDKPSPELSKHGAKSVIYYVTKYIMKASEKEQKRQQFLRLNLDEFQYKAAWNVIKCRMTVSKGFGLDAHFSTEDVQTYVPWDCPLDLQGRIELYNRYVDGCTDLPLSYFDFYHTGSTVRRRVMHPNPDVISRIKKDITRDLGEKPYPVFVNYEGLHVPLAEYYKKRADIYTPLDLLDIWYAYDPTGDVDRSALPKEEKDKLYNAHNKKLQILMQNSPFDTSPALLFPGEQGNSYQTISM